MSDEVERIVEKVYNSLEKEVKIQLLVPSSGSSEIKDICNTFAEKLSFGKVAIEKGEWDGKYPLMKFKENMIYKGLPVGYEFSTYLFIVELLGSGRIRYFKDSDIQRIKRYDGKKVVIETLVAPSCPHCPYLSYYTLTLAYLNDNIEGTVIDLTFAKEYIRKYSVTAVPVTFINGKEVLCGAVPSKIFVNAVLQHVE